MAASLVGEDFLTLCLLPHFLLSPGGQNLGKIAAALYLECTRTRVMSLGWAGPCLKKQPRVGTRESCLQVGCTVGTDAAAEGNPPPEALGWEESVGRGQGVMEGPRPQHPSSDFPFFCALSPKLPRATLAPFPS